MFIFGFEISWPLVVGILVYLFATGMALFSKDEPTLPDIIPDIIPDISFGTRFGIDLDNLFGGDGGGDGGG